MYASLYACVSVFCMRQGFVTVNNSLSALTAIDLVWSPSNALGVRLAWHGPRTGSKGANESHGRRAVSVSFVEPRS